MPLTAGQVLQNRYRIDALLGQGGMGAVYSATDLTFSAPVALKENLAATSEGQKQFAREAGLLYRLRHPNLPRVIDYFVIPGWGQYLVMDYVDGEDLDQVLVRQGRLPEPQALAWIGQVLSALEYLHSQSIVHRDVKPANVKITPDGRVFLVDFGLAKVGDPGQLTTTGARAVTPGYAPPEQYGIGRTDARSDVYSAGATLYALLAGQPPPDALQFMTGQALFSPLRQLNPAVSSHVETAVQRAMQTRPADRFQTAAEFRAALAAPMPQPQPTPQPRKQSQPVVRTPQSPPVLTAVAEPELIYIPAGQFLMGSTAGDRDAVADEKPQHRVHLSEYWIGKYPVTNAQYAAFVQATGYGSPKHWRRGRPPQGKETHPVVWVDWDDAAAYCGWLAEVTGKPYCLPTEAEWEKAARGTDGRVYPWGSTWDPRLCNSDEGGPGDTTSVGIHSPHGDSPYGCADMAGNIWEWVDDWYDGRYYAHSPDRDPTGPDSGTDTVMRGGSWLYGHGALRCAFRDFDDPGYRGEDVGFRIAVAPSSP